MHQNKARFVAIISICLSAPVYATLHSGTDTLWSSTFDFSNPAAVINADLEYVAKPTGGGEALIGNNTLVATADTCFDSVRSAPLPGYVFVVTLNDTNRQRVFCLKTMENRYAKFKILGYARSKIIIIQWAYQDDGSRDFGSIGISRPATATTWGSLKRRGNVDSGADQE